MNSLILGGWGYIGQNLALKLDKFVMYDRKDGNDILNRDTLDRFMGRTDVCFHLAAVSSISECEKRLFEAMETNLWGTKNVMESASKHGVKVVFASSFAVYNPTSVYGLTKALGEKIVTSYGGVVCRISNVYGGYKYLELKDTAVARLLKGKFEIRGNWNELRDYIHVDDVVDNLVEATELPNGSVVNICTNHWVSVRKLVELSKEPSFPDNLRKLGMSSLAV